MSAVWVVTGLDEVSVHVAPRDDSSRGLFSQVHSDILVPQNQCGLPGNYLPRDYHMLESRDPIYVILQNTENEPLNRIMSPF